MRNWSVLVAVVILFCAVSPAQSCEVEGRWTATQRTFFYHLDLTLSLHPNSSYTAEASIGYLLGSCRCQVQEEGTFKVDDPPSSVLVNTASCQAAATAWNTPSPMRSRSSTPATPFVRSWAMRLWSFTANNVPVEVYWAKGHGG